MIFRSLDGSGDWEFGKGKESYQYGQGAIGLNIKTRLLSFLNDCFFDMNAGIDWFTYFGLPNKNDEILLRARAVILQSYGVVSVNKIDLIQNRSTRNAVITYNINTIYTTQYVENLQVVNYA